MLGNFVEISMKFQISGVVDMKSISVGQYIIDIFMFLLLPYLVNLVKAYSSHTLLLLPTWSKHKNDVTLY